MKEKVPAGESTVTRRKPVPSKARGEGFAAHVAAMLAITRVHFALPVPPEGSLPLPVAAGATEVLP